MITNFINHFVDFIRKNTWVLVVYILILVLLFVLPGSNPDKSLPIGEDKDKSLRILNAIITSSLHFIGDIFIMMMIDDYQNGNRKSGSRYQLIATIVFTTAKLYCALFEKLK